MTNEVSISIYPFENLTESRHLDSLCNSFYIDLLTEFARFRQFKLIPHEVLIDSDICSEYSFRGSVRYVNNRLKVNARLINNRKKMLSWADSHEIDPESNSSVHEKLLREVVTVMQSQVNHDLLIDIRKKSHLHRTAYEYWLYGMNELKKGSLEADDNARIFFQKAIDIDSTYALAYSGMSLTYFNEWSCQLWDRWDISQKGAYQWALKAFELDEQSYIAAVVLGRIYIYEGEFDLGEYYLRKALFLNPNDTDYLMQIVTCLVYLGHLDEAEHLYDNAPTAGRLKADNAHVAALIAYEKGELRKCIELAAHARHVWVDFSALLAAAYYEINDHESMQRSWRHFEEDFKLKIANGKVTNNSMIQWLVNVNPYKKGTRQVRFWKVMNQEEGAFPEVRQITKISNSIQTNFFVKEGNIRMMTFDGKTIRMRDSKGLGDLEKILREPHRQFHCTELSNSNAEVTPVYALDNKAKRAYRNRLQELQMQIDSGGPDYEQTAALQNEYDGIVQHLRASLGLKGSSRRLADPIDKIRSAVTWRIRTAIRKIEVLHPSLAKHLSISIKTGLLNFYDPERPTSWLTDEIFQDTRQNLTP